MGFLGRVDFSLVNVADLKQNRSDQSKIVAYHYQTQTKIYIKTEYRVKNTTIVMMETYFV